MLKKYWEFIKENLTPDQPKNIYNPKNLISEICVSMLLINNNFLDKIIDMGQKARYSENSSVFLTDLKNLMIAKNRLCLGTFQNERCVEDNEISKVNSYFDSVEFDIEKDWTKLINSRIIARNIIDKLIPNDKLREEQIKKIYWIGPNKTKENSEDIVIELEDNSQYSFYLNKNLNLSKTASFNTFADELIGTELDNLFGEQYISKWDKLTQNWIKIIYENANKNMQVHIEKFIDPKRIDSISYFNYFTIKHGESKYQYLGELIKEFDKNIVKFSDLLNEIWKNRDTCFMDPQRVYQEWMQSKIFILNSKILEHLFTESLIKNSIKDIKKLDDGFKLAGGRTKMKIIKTIVEKLGCLEKPLYYLGNNGNVFHQVPSRQFFRDNYKKFKVSFDYHVKMIIDNQEEDNNDFTIRMRIEYNNNVLLNCNIKVHFSGGEMSGKLSAKYVFVPSDNFNALISDDIIDRTDNYREDDDSTFTHNGVDYSVNKALKMTQGMDTENVPVKELKWILDHTDVEENRVSNADTNTPIIVTKEDDIWYVLDGAHRLTKAVESDMEEIPAKVIEKDDLEKCKI